MRKQFSNLVKITKPEPDILNAGEAIIFFLRDTYFGPWDMLLVVEFDLNLSYK